MSARNWGILWAVEARILISKPERRCVDNKSARRVCNIPRKTPVIVLIAVLLVVTLGCTRGSDPAPQPKRSSVSKNTKPLVRSREPQSRVPTIAQMQGQNVILIVSEALRVDALGCYGGDPLATPHLDRLAKEGVVFEKLHSASPWTLPSMGSMLSGVSPTVHEAGETKDIRPGKSSKEVVKVREDIPLLPQMLEGIITAAIMNNHFLHPRWGLNRGFTEYSQREAGFGTSLFRPATRVMVHALDWVRRHSKQRFFMLLHLFDPHVPYLPPQHLRKKFAAGDKGRIDPMSWEQFDKIHRNQMIPTLSEQAYMRGLYKAEVASMDLAIGQLYEGLDKLGMLENTWIVFTADHGEEFWDHGGYEHGHRYEEEVTHVPLIIRAPGGKKWGVERIPVSVRHVDIMPTIVQMFGLEHPKDIEGESLLSLFGSPEGADRPAYMEYNLRVAQRVAYYDGRYKIIVQRKGNKGYMYDLLEDPLEKSRLGPAHPEFARMQKALEGYRLQLEKAGSGSIGEKTAPELPKNEEQSLKRLGYL